MYRDLLAQRLVRPNRMELWMMNADGSQPRFLVNGSGVQWSPDGKRIAYVAKGEPAGAQLFVRYMDSEGAVTQVSHLSDVPSSLQWSPDGRYLAFSMSVPGKRDDPFARVALPAGPYPATPRTPSRMAVARTLASSPTWPMSNAPIRSIVAP